MTMSIPSTPLMTMEKSGGGSSPGGRRRRRMLGKQMMSKALSSYHRRKSDDGTTTDYPRHRLDDLDRSQRSNVTIDLVSEGILPDAPPLGGLPDGAPPAPPELVDTVVFKPSDYDGGDCLEKSQNTASTVSTATAALDDSVTANTKAASLTEEAEETGGPPVSTGVSFGTVQVREYPRILGDNPSVTSGPPITLDWGHDPSTVLSMDLDEYECTKPAPREKFQMLVPHMVREDWLRNAGHSRGEITEAVEEVKRIKAKRNKTATARRGSMEFIKEEVRESFGKMRRRCSM